MKNENFLGVHVTCANMTHFESRKITSLLIYKIHNIQQTSRVVNIHMKQKK